jgi:hypothetical protein
MKSSRRLLLLRADKRPLRVRRAVVAAVHAAALEVRASVPTTVARLHVAHDRRFARRHLVGKCECVCEFQKAT